MLILRNCSGQCGRRLIVDFTKLFWTVWRKLSVDFTKLFYTVWRRLSVDFTKLTF